MGGMKHAETGKEMHRVWAMSAHQFVEETAMLTEAACGVR
jgi:hypothetical protein